MSSAPQRSKRPYVVTAALVVVATGAAATAFVLHDGDPATATGAQKTATTSTAPITRGDVVETESVSGKLTYSAERSILAAATGTVTWVPVTGARINRGQSLFSVDNKPITLMYGNLPLYRALSYGVDDGPDVKELERNLKALGYGDDMTVDNEFTAVTKAAVKDWQEDRGLAETGSVDAGQVVFESGAVRVSDVKVNKGDHAGSGPALTVTAIAPSVHVDLDVSLQDLVHKGGKVDVEMPDGDTVRGKITKVGSVASAGQDGDSPTVGVDISLTKKAAGRLDQAPVTVDLVSSRAKNVLSVPVEALLGLREGGFGVQVIEGATTRIVAITPGTYGGGRVEVSGDGLTAGMKVEVPAS
jgi:peptidoglycan hydrolase-like protein with peptidoglycan-binding domain